MGSKHKKKKHRETTKEARKRKFAYRSLQDVDCPKVYDGDYDREAYEYFKSVKWDAAWKEFLVKEKDGRYKHQTVWALCKELAEKDKEGAKIIYAAIGPYDKRSKKIVPYLGDWGLNRSSFMIGEVNKESLLYSNPKIQTLRELVKKHLDVMEISQGLGEILMGWVGRYDTWATQVDEYFKYKLFDPKVSDEKNEKRFAKYTKMQEYIFSRTIDSVRQVLRCFGVGENDVALLTQMMIAAMRERLGGDAARIMMASATGVKVIDGQIGMTSSEPGDATVLDGTNKAFNENPHLKLLMGTFVTKSQVYNMAHPDINLGDVSEEDTRTDPALDPPKVKLNGKHANGKQTMKQ